MSLMDKVKAQAEQALALAQQGVAQGQDKLDSLQTKRSEDGLLRRLGAAFYAEQRTGGSNAAVQAALAAVDRHTAEHGAVDTTPAPFTADTSGDISAPAAPAQPGLAHPAPAPPAPAHPAPAQSFDSPPGE